MKRIVISLVLTLLCVTTYSQVSYGRFVMFPDSKLPGSMWKPQINFTRLDDQDIIGIRTCASDTYHSFDTDSRVLGRFADSTIVKLPIIPEFEVQKSYNNTWVGNVLVDNYVTYSFYNIEDETIAKIVEKLIPIVKIRIVFTNGNVSDYEIKPSYQKKLTDGLIKSRIDAISQKVQRASNSTDENF